MLVRQTTADVVARVVEFRRLAGIFPRPPLAGIRAGEAKAGGTGEGDKEEA